MSAPRLTTSLSREIRRSSGQYLHVHALDPVTFPFKSTPAQPAVTSPKPTSPSQRPVISRDPGSNSQPGIQTWISRFNAPVRSYSQQSGSAISRFARSASSPGAAAETYVAYGMTQKLFEACSSQADYQIPQAFEKGATIPSTESGEHLGVGDSWWYRGG